MADDLEKFVLQYNVDLKDSISRLEQLQARMTTTGQTADDAAAKGGRAFDGLAQRVIATKGEVRALGAEFAQAGVGAGMMGAAAATGISAIAIAIVYSIAQMKRLNEEFQRTKQLAFEMGTTSMNMMQNRRQYGAVGLRTEEADHIQSTVSSKISDAYIAMDPMAESAVRLRAAGIDVYGKNGQRQSTDAGVEQLEQKLKSVTQAQAYAIGTAIGLTQRETDAIRARNAATDASAKFTDAETVRMYEAQKASDQLTQAQVRLDTAVDAVGQKLGGMFLPVWADMETAIADFLEGMPQKLEAFGEGYTVFSAEFQQAMNMIQEPWKYANKNWGDEISAAGQDALDKRRADYAATLAEAKKNTDAAQQQKAASDQMERSIKQFGAAVQAFTSYQDQSDGEAMANWAASIGEKNGLKGMGNGFDTRPAYQRQAGGYGNGPGVAPAASQYDAQIEKVWGKYADVGKAIMSVESGGDPNAKNKNSSASGLMQVLKGSWKEGENPFDPETSIKQGYRVFMEKMKATGGDVQKSVRYYGENTDEYVNKVYSRIPGRQVVQDATHGMDNMNPYGVQPPKGVGGTRDIRPYAETWDTRFAMDAQKRMAANLGVPLAQLNQPGGVSNTDKSIAYDQLKIDTLRNLASAKVRYESLNNAAKSGQVGPKFSPAAIGKAQDDYINAQNDWRGVQLLGQGTPGGGAGYEGMSRTGPQTLTVNAHFTFASGTPSVEIQKTEAELQKIIKGQSNDIVNNNNSGVSH